MSVAKIIDDPAADAAIERIIELTDHLDHLSSVEEVSISGAEREALERLSADERKAIKSVSVHRGESIIVFVSGTEFEAARNITRTFARIVSDHNGVTGVTDGEEVWTIVGEGKGASA
jgi:hypothetical protein